MFYTPHPEEDKRLGTIGHVRMDFGRSGNEFWHTWWPRGPEELNSPAFKAELQQIVGKLREDVLKSRFAMERFCYDHGGKIDGGYVQNYGYIVETERYRYCLRCNPSPGDYNGYLTAYDLAVQRQNIDGGKNTGRPRHLCQWRCTGIYRCRSLSQMRPRGIAVPPDHRSAL